MAKGDIKSQLGSFVRGALAQLDSVREVVVQKAEAGRIQIDVAMLKRRRREVLVELGSIVAKLAAEEKITEEVFPEIGPALAQLAEMDDRIAVEEDRARRVSSGAPGDDKGYAGHEVDTSPVDGDEPGDGDDVGAAGDDDEDLDTGSKRG